MQPSTEIIPLTMTDNLLLEGSDGTNPLTPGTEIVIGGDLPSSPNNSTNKSLWDEE